MAFIYREMSKQDKKKIRWKSIISLGRLQKIKEEKLYWAIDSEKNFFIICYLDGDWTGEYLLRYGIYSYKGQQVKFAYIDDFQGNIIVERLIIPRKIKNSLNLIKELFKEGISAYMTGIFNYAHTNTANVTIKEVFILPKRTFSSYYYEFKNRLVQNAIDKKILRLFWLFCYSLSIFFAVFVWGLITD